MGCRDPAVYQIAAPSPLVPWQARLRRDDNARGNCARINEIVCDVAGAAVQFNGEEGGMSLPRRASARRRPSEPADS